jgi:L-serine dehydratase
MKTSLFEIFKIGIGPSSSHTVGPMRAANDFVARLAHQSILTSVRRVQTDLYGSLALTGRGHGTDRAILLGLYGELPDKVDPETIETRVAAMRASRALLLRGVYTVPFDESHDLLFRKGETVPGHSNAMRFSAFDEAGSVIAREMYYSIGGGFVVRKGEQSSTIAAEPVPFPFSSTAELLRQCEDHGKAIWQIAFENENTWHGETEIRSYVSQIWNVMQSCMNRGLKTEGVLPGGLNVRRRAPNLAKKLTSSGGSDPLAAMDWVSVFAIAVNEENAAGSRIVTAPTNGAAGVIPAVAHYYKRFVKGASDEGLFRYFLTASSIGILYKENASISGAEVGCQGEVGVACSMAAGGLVAAVGGNNEQVEHAAEIGMEHNLGMTCDPIAGLVQIPCIERNAMAAAKAISACRLAMQETGEHKVSLDQVIKTMYETGRDMQSRYKETSLGGLATLNIIEC